MKTALIISGGMLNTLLSSQLGLNGLSIVKKINYDMIIACDCGIENARALGLYPQYLIGDFDSYNLDNNPFPDALVIRHPVIKDDTDTMLAIRYALELGINNIQLIGAVGGRTDHTLANIQALKFISNHGGVGEIITDTEYLRTISPKDGIVELSTSICEKFLSDNSNINPEYTVDKKDTFSLLALSDICRGVSIKGALYSGDNFDFTNDFPLGHGNHFIAENAYVRVNEGILLAIVQL